MSLNKFDDCLGVKFADAASIRRKLAYLCRPEDKTPVEAADDELWISNGTDVTKFLSSQVPYMREPMNSLPRRIYDVVALMGPARSGKTKALVEGWINYALTQSPGDMLLIYSTKKKAESRKHGEKRPCTLLFSDKRDRQAQNRQKVRRYANVQTLSEWNESQLGFGHRNQSVGRNLSLCRVF